MANSNDKYAEINDIIKVFGKKLDDLSRKHKADLLKYQSELLESERKQKLENELENLKTAIKLKSKYNLDLEKEIAKYAKKQEQEKYKDKLASEIFILKEISKKEQDRRDREIRILEKEREIIKLKNKGALDEAKIIEKQLKKEKRKSDEEDKKDRIRSQNADYQFGDNLRSIFEPLKEEIAAGNSFKRSMDIALLNSIKAVGKAINDSLNVINQSISDYAKYQTSINARLQGRTTFSELVDKLDSVAFSPLVSANDLYRNLNQLVAQGIVSNVEQRAFFETVKDGIAATFDATSESLNRIIRIQRNDSTAARLGMESYLTRFLNVYVENTEYLQSTFDTVASSLLEASAVIGELKGVGASLEFEYVVQKWLGTLTGMGLSESTAQSIASALGRLGAGDVGVLTSDVGTLLTMSASAIGKNIGDILNDGLDAETTNKLLSSMVNYLRTIASSGSNVTRAELGKIFGVSMSDLVAILNMDQNAIRTVTDELLSYPDMYTKLRQQFAELPGRMGIANQLENLFSNLTYQTGMSIASNPISYAIWKITDLIQGVTGGINIPFVTALGTGIDLNTTVENLMKLGIVGTNMLGNIGDIVGGINSWGKGELLLDRLRINAGTSQLRSFGGNQDLAAGIIRSSGTTTSQTTYIGQESADAYYQSTINKQKSDAQKELKTIINEEESNPVVKYLTNTVKLKENIEAITVSSDKQNNLLGRINSDVVSISSMLSRINSNLVEKILPAIDNVASLSFGSRLPDKSTVIPLFTSENTLINTSLTNVSTVSSVSPVAEYLEKINFIDDFKSIVENISEINKKIPASFTYGNSTIEGLTQFNRRA